MIQIDVTTDTLSAALQRAVAAYSDMSDLMDIIGEEMVDRTKANLDTGVSPDGTPFAPRSATTLKSYERQGKVPVGGPLKLTGDMRNGIFAEAGSDFVSWGPGASAIQAAVMQFGAEQGEFGALIGKDKNGRDFFMMMPWGDIPARPFLGIGPEDETAILALITEWSDSVIEG